jgi:transposase
VSTTSLRACCEWRDQALEAAAERFESGQDRSLQAERRRKIAQLERALGRKTYELEIAGEALRMP